MPFTVTHTTDNVPLAYVKTSWSFMNQRLVSKPYTVASCKQTKAAVLLVQDQETVTLAQYKEAAHQFRTDFYPQNVVMSTGCF